MKSILKTIVISLMGLALLGGAGYWAIQSFGAKDGSDIAAVAERIEQREANEISAETAEGQESTKKVELEMEEWQLQTSLHQMTHQKIVADKKRGALEMSRGNIESMLTIVRSNYDYYEHSDFYEKTLMAWQNGDFSNAVSVHNTIWDWHNGTVGRATGLMSKAQEEEYIKKHFR